MRLPFAALVLAAFTGVAAWTLEACVSDTPDGGNGNASGGDGGAGGNGDGGAGGGDDASGSGDDGGGGGGDASGGGGDAGGGAQRTVFVTSDQFAGQDLQGIAGADAHCNAAAADAGLPGSYMAWLSDQLGHTPGSRFTKAPAEPYVLRNGTEIAKSYTDLTTNGLEAKIDVDEHKNKVAATTVVTDTHQNGGTDTGIGDCNHWSGDDGRNVWAGTTGSLTGYTDSVSNLPCTSPAALYCFQQ